MTIARIACAAPIACLGGAHVDRHGVLHGPLVLGNRGAETTFDISADLEELAQTPVAVVCAGAKALLDLPKTLEYLETRGVPVMGTARTSFRRSGAGAAGCALASAWTPRWRSRASCK
jgi:pseudouridine-5'-phosphate glycosidase